MQLEVTAEAKEHIIKLGYDVAYGARPLRRVIQNMIEDGPDFFCVGIDHALALPVGEDPDLRPRGGFSRPKTSRCSTQSPKSSTRIAS